MRPMAVSVVCLALTACSPKTDDGSLSQEPADAPKAVEPAPLAPPAALPGFSGAIDARGTEPFWALQIRPEGLRLQRPDKPDVTAANPGPRAEGDAAAWGASTDALQVRLRKAACSDGMSDREYPMSAEVRAGAETLTGCADATS